MFLSKSCYQVMTADLMQEQLVIILTTTLTLLTAWAWNSVFQQYLDQFYGKNLHVKTIYAISITIITFILISWLFQHFNLAKKPVEKKRGNNTTKYVLDAI